MVAPGLVDVLEAEDYTPLGVVELAWDCKQYRKAERWLVGNEHTGPWNNRVPGDRTPINMTDTLLVVRVYVGS